MKKLIYCFAIVSIALVTSCTDSEKTATTTSADSTNTTTPPQTKSDNTRLEQTPTTPPVDPGKKTEITVGQDGAGVKHKTTDVNVGKDGIEVGTKDVKIDINTKKK